MSNNPNYNSLDTTSRSSEQTDVEPILSKKKKKSPKKLQEEGESHEYDELLSSTYQSSDVVSFPTIVNPLTQNPLIPSSKRRVYPPELLNKKPEVLPTSENSTEKEKTSSKKKKKSPKHHNPNDVDYPFLPPHPLTHLHSAGEDSGDDKDEVEEILSINPYYKHKSASLNEFHPYCVGLYIAIFIFAVALCYGILALTQTFACLGPPYLYVTHKGSKNIMKFSRDGCLIHEKVLWGVSNQESDLRGMAYGKYNQKEVLYVGDANTDMSGVIMFGECFDSTSLRPFVSRVVTAVTNPGALHTYGIAVDHNGDIYASFQKSDAVLRFTSQTFQPIPNRADLTPIFYFTGNMSKFVDHGDNKKDKKKDDKPGNSSTPTTTDDNNPTNTNNGTTTEKTKKNKEKKNKHKDDENNSTTTTTTTRRLTDEPQHRHLRTIEQPNFNELQNISAFFAQQKYGNIQPSDYFNGTFVQFGFPYYKHDSTERGIRSIVWVKNYTELWIANQDLNAVVIVDREGTFLSSIWIKNPIGMYHSEHDHPNLIFISSKQKKLGGVFAFDVESRMQVRSYQSIGMNHPTGMVSYHDILFVGDQSRNAVITFNITTSRVIKLIIPSTKLHGEIEHIILSHC